MIKIVFYTGENMSFFNLKLIRKSDTLFVLTIPLVTRIILLIFAAAVASTFVINPGFSFLPAFITVILIFSALYEEYWSFNCEKKEVISRFGLLILSKKTVIPFDLIEKFQIEGFVRGSMTQKPETDESNKKKLFQTEYFKWSLINRDFGELTINTVKGRDRENILVQAGEIATLCQKSLSQK